MKMSNGKNVLSADNQQERLDPMWIVGFVDGEGCFYVGINQHNRTLKWQLLPEFRVVQHERNENSLLKNTILFWIWHCWKKQCKTRKSFVLED